MPPARAYHTNVTLETRDGIRDVSAVPDPIATSGYAVFVSAVRESAGVKVVPRITRIRWEDYGGVRDSVLSPEVTHLALHCYSGPR